MKRLRLLLLIACIGLLLLSCGSRYVWKHPNSVELNPDRLACWRGLPAVVGADCVKHMDTPPETMCKPGVEAGEHIQTIELSSLTSERMVNSCLESKGWRQRDLDSSE
jgi:hypothetical protein